MFIEDLWMHPHGISFLPPRARKDLVWKSWRWITASLRPGYSLKYWFIMTHWKYGSLKITIYQLRYFIENSMIYAKQQLFSMKKPKPKKISMKTEKTWIFQWLIFFNENWKIIFRWNIIFSMSHMIVVVAPP